MSNIDKQALREEFRNMQDHYSDPADRERQEIYIAAEAALDELDSANGYASAYEAEKWHYHGMAESEGERANAAEKRVAELEELLTAIRKARPGGVYFNKWDTQIANVLSAAAGKGE